MMKRKDIQSLVVYRILKCVESCNSYHINHVMGQIKSLVVVLNDGDISFNTEDIREVLTAAGIPWKPHPDNPKNGWYIPRGWLKKRGFKVSQHGSVSHPKFNDW
jgi:hypothetical protein